MLFKDFLLGPLFFFVVFFIANSLKSRLTSTPEEEKYYIRALIIKLLSVTFFAFIYQFYYRGGDTMGFYKWSSNYFAYLLRDTDHGLSFLFTSNMEEFFRFKYNMYADGYGYLLKYGTRELTFIKLTSIINIFALNSYLSTSYIFVLFSLLGNWLLYKVFIDIFPKLKRKLAYAVLFIPSVSFWGTGILKDTITFAALGFMVYSTYKIFVKREKMIRNIIILLVSIYFIMILKAYIVIAFIPAGVIWVFNEQKAKIKSSVIRTVSTPFFLILMVVTFIGLVAMIGESAGRFSISNLEQTTKDFQGWHEVASKDGSGYVISNTGTSLFNLLKVLPESIIVTYFRPFLWEARGLVVLMAAVESLIMLFYFLRVFLYKGKIFGFIRALNSRPVIQMCAIFALLFGFVVGFTSFNFGALSRYKIPSMPFFVGMLTMISYQIDVLEGKIK